MDDSGAEFSQHIVAILRRFFAQNAEPAPGDGELAAFGARLWGLVLQRGLPRPLAPGEPGSPGEMGEAQCAPLAAHVLAGAENPLLAEAARQLVKTCFYPEFKMCRDSYRHATPDGSCRRQQLDRVRKRVSGTHCVDCPHWVELAPEQHVAFLGAEWRSDPAEFAAHREVFLPEDFRALRRWLHAKARRASSAGL